MRTHALLPSPLGEITLVAEDGALTGCYMELHRRGTDEEDRLGARDDDSLSAAAAQLTEYFAGERTEFSLPLAPRGDEFQLRVWALLREIPYGQTRSYGDLARALGDVNLSQRVGWANGRNPISIIVPCHRVIGADGSLVGYAGGLERKRFLLALEEPPADEASRLF
ncbi:methylated-DNA--[protein]-cysteine S-methyltransferase [Pedococcus bigeumensis]|uniref:methylated-DNA--[protein]-cysteine S-methyltransferase n=1 Tax=Pedococcus bigeumensis TaxID=433644 RepID=UPI001F4F1E4B|nr:methylated-DNA--[protein]-cysteine S-methyltransferase [Pedococcus bigeumensis]